MYDVPVGETPGWSGPAWLNFEVSQASIWNVPGKFIDNRTGNTLDYKAMYEQTSAIAELGFEVLPSLAFSIEVPYLSHNSGFFSDFVKQFHWAVGSDTFERPSYPGYPNTYSFGVNDQDALATDRPEGVGNLKFKLKYWLWHWMGDEDGSCDCGLAISGNIKVPTQQANRGLTSGSTDITELIHFGIPLFDHSGIYGTAAFSQLGVNKNMAAWPTRRDYEMYEIDGDFALSDSGFGLLLQLRYNSPILNGQYLSFSDPGVTDPQQLASDREATGWNSLVYWTGYQAIGFRQRWSGGTQLNFLFQEDFAIGGVDGRSTNLYINDAPDFSFLLQLHIVL